MGYHIVSQLKEKIAQHEAYMDILQATIFTFGDRCDGLVKENMKLKSKN
jgi:hypothetical protein